MTFKYKIVFLVSPLIFLLDQWSKWWIVQHVRMGERLPVIAGFFDIVHFRNTGAAFGLFSDMHHSFRSPFFYIVALLAVIALSFFIRSLPAHDRLQSTALALVFGGIAGNILDRIRFGEVVDFVSCHLGNRVADWSFWGYRLTFPLEWPAFNVADSAISVAMVLLILSAFRK